MIKSQIYFKASHSGEKGASPDHFYTEKIDNACPDLTYWTQSSDMNNNLTGRNWSGSQTYEHE